MDSDPFHSHKTCFHDQLPPSWGLLLTSTNLLSFPPRRPATGCYNCRQIRLPLRLHPASPSWMPCRRALQKAEGQSIRMGVQIQTACLTNAHWSPKARRPGEDLELGHSCLLFHDPCSLIFGRMSPLLVWMDTRLSV